MKFLGGLYTQDDFGNLPALSVKEIRKELIEQGEIEKEADVREYMYIHRNELAQNPKYERIIQSQILAGIISVRWMKFTYQGFFTPQFLKQKLESDENGFNKDIPTNVDTFRGDQIVCIWENDAYYTLRVILDLGMKKVPTGIGFVSVPNRESVIVNIDIDRCWVEIRTAYKYIPRVINVLKQSLGMENMEIVKLRDKYDNVEAFKNSLVNGFYYNSMATPSENIDLSVEVKTEIFTLFELIDNYVVTRDSKVLCSALDDMKLDFGGHTLSRLLLANLGGININTKLKCDKDISESFMYGITKKDIVENGGCIRFSTAEGGAIHTVQVALGTDTFFFRSSVDEEVIAYIREKLI